MDSSKNRAAATYSDRNTPMRRPKEPSNVTTLMLIQKIGSLNFDNSDEGILVKCKELYTCLTPTEESVSNVFLQIHANCLIDGEIVRKVAKFVKSLVSSGMNVFNIILPLLQEDFEGRLTFFGTEQFRNAMVLLGEFYDTFIIAKNVGLAVLATPLVEYMKLALTSSDPKDLQPVLLQLLINAEKLQVQGGQPYQEFIVNLRRNLISNNARRYQCCLLLSLDILSGNFPMTDGPMQDFYVETIGDVYSSLLFRATGKVLAPTPTVITPTVPEISPSVTNGNNPNPSLVKSKPPPEKQKAVEPASTNRKPSSAMSTDVHEVRGRMRALGLLPKPGESHRLSFTKKLDQTAHGVQKLIQIGSVVNEFIADKQRDAGEKDDEFYGVQLPRFEKKSEKEDLMQARAVPLPGDDWD